jgi:hypothetical protein
MEQPTYVMVAAIVLGLVLVGLAIVVLTRGKRHKELKERFGPEYDRTVSELGKRSKAEKELDARAKRVEKLRLRPLSASDRQRYQDLWRAAQAHFVDNPLSAVAEADALVAQAMGAVGYPVTDFDQRAADVSVDHPVVVDNYRRAHAIAVSAQNGSATTEDMRQAVVYYRALFEELLRAPAGDREPEREPEPVMH